MIPPQTPRLDPSEARQFWKKHDQMVPVNGALDPEGLSHSLYRGMPHWFNRFFHVFHRRTFLSLLSKCGELQGRRVLDLGCGTGRWATLMAEKGALVTGIDIGERVIQENGNKYPHINFAVMDALNLGFPPQSFYFVSSVAFLQHIPYDVQGLAVDQIHRVLEPYGFVLMIELTDKRDRGAHVYPNTRSEWISCFRARGFSLWLSSGCEYLPYVRAFHIWRGLSQPGQHASDGSEHRLTGVEKISKELGRNTLLRLALIVLIQLSYPLEILCALLLPSRWARYGAFLFFKEGT